jgi:hypothetical protein
MFAKADAICWSEDVCVDPAAVTGDAQMRLVYGEIDTMRDAGDKGGRQSERQKTPVGFLPAAISAMPRWIAAPADALHAAGFHTSATAIVLHRAAPIQRAITTPRVHSCAATCSITPRRHVEPGGVDTETA